MFSFAHPEVIVWIQTLDLPTFYRYTAAKIIGFSTNRCKSVEYYENPFYTHMKEWNLEFDGIEEKLRKLTTVSVQVIS